MTFGVEGAKDWESCANMRKSSMEFSYCKGIVLDLNHSN